VAISVEGERYEILRYAQNDTGEELAMTTEKLVVGLKPHSCIFGLLV